MISPDYTDSKKSPSKIHLAQFKQAGHLPCDFTNSTKAWKYDSVPDWEQQVDTKLLMVNKKNLTR